MSPTKKKRPYGQLRPCSAPFCTKKPATFSAPKNEKNRKLWSEILLMSDISEHARFCQEHFDKSDILQKNTRTKLKPGCLPLQQIVETVRY